MVFDCKGCCVPAQDLRDSSSVSRNLGAYGGDSELVEDRAPIAPPIIEQQPIWKAKPREEPQLLPVPPPTKEERPAASERERNKDVGFEGAWEEPGTKRVNIVQGNQLKWANTSTGETGSLGIKIRGDKLEMNVQGDRVTGEIDDEMLRWSDGDFWRRAGLNGSWVDDSSDMIYTVDGADMYFEQDGARKIRPIVLESLTSFSIMVKNLKTTAELNDTATSLQWSDGDVWTRLGSD